MPNLEVNASSDESVIERLDVDGESFIFELPRRFSHIVVNRDYLNWIKKKTKVNDLGIRLLAGRDGGEFVAKKFQIFG